MPWPVATPRWTWTRHSDATTTKPPQMGCLMLGTRVDNILLVEATIFEGRSSSSASLL